jgi:hypothetical protein
MGFVLYAPRQHSRKCDGPPYLSPLCKEQGPVFRLFRRSTSVRAYGQMLLCAVVFMTGRHTHLGNISRPEVSYPKSASFLAGSGA